MGHRVCTTVRGVYLDASVILWSLLSLAVSELSSVDLASPLVLPALVAQPTPDESDIHIHDMTSHTSMGRRFHPF
jgi:hypothetical protein